MKLKYYMRGLGIGIILTTLILTLGNRTVSDQEVIKRATALGMAFQDEKNDRLNKMLEDKKGTLSPRLTPALTPVLTPAPEVTEVPEQETASEPDKTPEVTAAAEPDQAQETDVSKPEDGAEAGAASKEEISFRIERGMSSGQTAKVLEQAGLIQDADDFNQYIMEAGKASIIKVGEFEVKKGASYDEIINAITSK